MGLQDNGVLFSIGEFWNGLLNCKRALCFAEGKLKYYGNVSDEIPNGYGKLFINNRLYYEGDFR